MKRVLTASILFFALFAVCTFSRRTVQQIVVVSSQDVFLAQTFLDEDEKELAQDALQQSYQNWMENRDKLSVLLTHNTLDQIEEQYLRAQQYAADQQLEDCRAEVQELQYNLQQLGESEQFCLANIL